MTLRYRATEAAAARDPHGSRRLGRGPRALASLALLCGLAMLLTGCQSGILDPRGPIGAAEKTILMNSLVIMLAIVIPTIIGTLAFAWWFRASNDKAVHLPDWEFSGRVELVVWSIPVLVVLLLGGIAWIGSHDLDPFKKPDEATKALDVQVVSLDWKWLFIYPEQGIASINELVVPDKTPLHFTLTSASVMSAFFVPQLGSMIYTMNGMSTQLYLEAYRPGDFPGLSAHFNGDGFSDMHFMTRARSQDDFYAWVEKARAGGGHLDVATYLALSRQSTNLPVSTFAKVDADLFTAIATQRVAAGPGPAASVSPKMGD